MIAGSIDAGAHGVGEGDYFFDLCVQSRLAVVETTHFGPLPLSCGDSIFTGIAYLMMLPFLNDSTLSRDHVALGSQLLCFFLLPLWFIPFWSVVSFTSTAVRVLTRI